MSKRSRRRRALSSGAPAWPPGYGPGEPHWTERDYPPFEDPPGGKGGVREPRKPKPSPPALSAEAEPPVPPVRARDRTLPPPEEVTRALAGT